MMLDFDSLWPKLNIKPHGVLHVGANTGQEAEFYRDNGVKEVIWIEGHGPTFEKLQDHVKDIPGTTCIQACVSDRTSKTYLNVANNGSQSSSLLELGHHKVIHPEVEYVDSIPVTSVRLDELLKYRKFDGDWFLNVDVQGMDLAAMKGMGDLLHKFKWINTEVNNTEVYIGCDLVGDVDEYLKGFGFERVEIGDWVAGSWTDALYCKS